MHIRMFVLLLILLLVARMAFAEAPSHPTRLIDSFVITKVEDLAKTFPVVSPGPFLPRPMADPSG